MLREKLLSNTPYKIGRLSIKQLPEEIKYFIFSFIATISFLVPLSRPIASAFDKVISVLTFTLIEIVGCFDDALGLLSPFPIFLFEADYERRTKEANVSKQGSIRLAVRSFLELSYRTIAGNSPFSPANGRVFGSTTAHHPLR